MAARFQPPLIEKIRLRFAKIPISFQTEQQTGTRILTSAPISEGNAGVVDQMGVSAPRLLSTSMPGLQKFKDPLSLNCEEAKYNETSNVKMGCCFFLHKSPTRDKEWKVPHFPIGRACLKHNKHEALQAGRNAFFHREQNKL